MGISVYGGWSSIWVRSAERYERSLVYRPRNGRERHTQVCYTLQLIALQQTSSTGMTRAQTRWSHTRWSHNSIRLPTSSRLALALVPQSQLP